MIYFFLKNLGVTSFQYLHHLFAVRSVNISADEVAFLRHR